MTVAMQAVIRAVMPVVMRVVLLDRMRLRTLVVRPVERVVGLVAGSAVTVAVQQQKTLRWVRPCRA
jgi:hypothetical protein